MMRNESIKTKSFSYSLKKLQQRTRITLGDFQTPFLKEADRSDSTSVHQYIPRMLAASNVKHGSMATKFQAVFSMMLFRTWFAAFTLGGLIS